MIEVHTLVEGQTEETFVNEILLPYFAERHIFLKPVLVTTKRVKDGPNMRGGVVSYGKVRNDILKLLQNPQVIIVTTMFDYYGLPTSFPGVDDRPQGDCYACVDHLENALAADINNARFLPFLMLHEYEALLFSDPAAATDYLPNNEIVEALIAIRDSYESPEEINEGPTTHPSHRLTQLIADYQKPLHGPILALEMGLTTIRDACPHFNRWLTQLEELE